jgi:hypothetical protein
MIMDNERPVRISDVEICEITAVLGCYRLCCSDGGVSIQIPFRRLTTEYTGLRLKVVKIHTVTDSPQFLTPCQAF